MIKNLKEIFLQSIEVSFVLIRISENQGNIHPYLLSLFAYNHSIWLNSISKFLASREFHEDKKLFKCAIHENNV